MSLNPWLLPDGVVDLLPSDAYALEQLRRRLTDVLLSHGYELVLPAFIEYTESLLGRAQEDLKRQTFKLIDQLSGRLMGVRADVTQQVARIDAHVRPTQGIARYGYATQVLHTVPQALFASRTPFQLGAEIFGHAGLTADIELIELMLHVLSEAGFGVQSSHGRNQLSYEQSSPDENPLHIDLGNIAIFQALAEVFALNESTIATLCNLYDRKALPELKAYCASQGLSDDFYLLGSLSSNIDAVVAKLSVHAKASDKLMRSVLDLKRLQEHFDSQWSGLSVSVDAAQMSSYDYHTGIVFRVYKTSSTDHERLSANPVAQGGRYHAIGSGLQVQRQVQRPAVGFSCDLLNIIHTFKTAQGGAQSHAQHIVAAPALHDEALRQKVKQLRTEGKIVVNKLNDVDVANATHQLHLVDDTWQVVRLHPSVE